MHLTHSDDPNTVGIEAVRALHHRNTTDCAQTYASVLDWPVVVGHRYRRQAGCTCQESAETAPDCPAAGAHPLPGPLTPLRPEEIATAFEAVPGAGIIAPTDRFDALTLPHSVGLSLMLVLDRHNIYAPCLTTDHSRVTVLVAAGSGHPLASTTTVVHAGPDAWIALPPSHGTRWDTPPVPHLPLPHALAIRHHLERVIALAQRSGDVR